MILFILIVMWVVVLVPPYLKNRSVRGGRSLSLGSFGSSSSSAPNSLQALSSIQQGPAQTSATSGQGSTVVPFRRPGEAAPTAAAPVVGAPFGSTATGPQFNNDADLMFGGPSRGMALQAPMSLDDARRRRRNVLVGAFTLSVVLLGAAIQWQGIFTLLFLVSLAVSLGFVMVMVQNQRTADMQAATVAPLHPVTYQPQTLSVASPGYMPQQRSAN